MKIKHLISIILLIAVAAVNAQAQPDLPVKLINGTRYYYYEVQNKDNLQMAARAMGVSTDDVVRYNPWAAQGLEKKQLLFVPASLFTASGRQTQAAAKVENAFSHTDAGTVAITGSKPTTYVLQPGDNIYTVAKRFNVTVEGLLNTNRRLAPEQYVEGQTVHVTPNTALPFYCETASVRFDLYKVQDGESFYAIARKHGINQDDLQAANPDVKKPKKGKNIVVPRTVVEQQLVEMNNVSVDDLERYYTPRIHQIYEQLQADRRNNEINLAIVLPFQLHKSTPPHQAMLYTDFYKGFLLALDSARLATDKQINLRVYDTQHNLNVTDSILLLPELKNMDIIIAPSEPQQLQRNNRFGGDNGVSIFNCFSTKNEDYKTNPYVYQVNPPTPVMIQRVMSWFDGQFADYQVIYLDDNDNSDTDMFNLIKSHIEQGGKLPATLKVNGDLSFDNLSNLMNPGSKYVFIPSSSSKNLLKHVVKALKQAKEERFDCDMALLGYPEYVLYLKDYQTDLQDIDTYLFSRFFNAKGFRTRDVEALYSKWFSGTPLTSVPNMTLFGFDTGLYLIKSLAEGNIDESTPLHRGVQNSFRFERDADGGGMVNQAVDVVHFSTDHKITTLVQ